MTTKIEDGVRPQFQGDEQFVIIQSQTKKGLNSQIASVRAAAMREGRKKIRIRREVDPDGGYRAIVTSHNFNIKGWIGARLHRDKGERKEAISSYEAGEAEKASKKSQRREERQAGEATRRIEEASERKEREKKIAEEEQAKWARESAAREQARGIASERQARAEAAKAHAEEIRTTKTSEAVAKKATFTAEHPRVAAARETAKTAAKRMGKGIIFAPGTQARVAAVGVGRIVAEKIRTGGRRGVEVEETFYKSGERRSRTVTRKPGKGISIFPTMEAARGIGKGGDSLAYLRQIQMGGGGGGMSLAGRAVIGGDPLARLRQVSVPKIGLFGGVTMQTAPTVTIPPNLSEVQGKVYTAVTEDKAGSIEVIIQLTGLEKGQITRAIKALEKKGLLGTK